MPLLTLAIAAPGPPASNFICSICAPNRFTTQQVKANVIGQHDAEGGVHKPKGTGNMANNRVIRFAKTIGEATKCIYIHPEDALLDSAVFRPERLTREDIEYTRNDVLKEFETENAALKAELARIKGRGAK